MNKTIWIAVLALGAGCSKKQDAAKDKAGSAAPSAEATKPVEQMNAGGGDIPTPFAAFMPKDADAKWQGIWDGRLTLRTSGTMSMAGDPAAIKIEGNKATVWDGTAEKQVDFKLVSPCTANFVVDKDGAKYTFTKHFVVAGDNLQVGDGAAGYRKGTQALVCASDGVYVLDDKGACTQWENHFGKWESKPSTCAWAGDTLTLGTGDWATKVTAEGDILASDQFRDAQKQTPFTKATDWDAAKAKVTADVKAKDPGEIAKAAGGKVGDTSTVNGLVATYASDKASWKGKQVTVTALYLNSNTMSSGGETRYNIVLVDEKGKLTPSLSCYVKEEEKGLKQYDKVTVKGTVDESFDAASLSDCTVSKAK